MGFEVARAKIKPHSLKPVPLKAVPLKAFQSQTSENNEPSSHPRQ